MADQTPHSTIVLDLDTSTELAFARTRAAYERTMMSWIRTATSLITFGFSIYKFFQIEAPAGPRQHRLIGSREFAFMLVGLGLTSLILATLENRYNIRALDAQCSTNHRSLAVLLAALISLVGIVALFCDYFATVVCYAVNILTV